MSSFANLTQTIDRVFALDDWTPQKGCAAVVAGACCFATLEIVFSICSSARIRRFFRRNNNNNNNADPNNHKLDHLVTSSITKLVGTVFNCIAVPLAIAVLLSPEVGRAPVGTARIHAASPLSLAMCVTASSYFLYDLCVVLLRFDAEGAGFLVHAVCCLFVYGYAVFTNVLHFHGANFLIWETSTAFVHARWALYHGGMADTRLYLANGLALLATFFAARNVFGLFCSVAFFRDTAEELALAAKGQSDFAPAAIYCYRVANVALNALNALWVSKIAKGAVALVFGKKAGKKKVGDRKVE